jgi:beta-glucosidase/6-phospho-beta-glucosidase/beta-galactosidase
MTASFPPGFLWGAATSAYQVEGSLDADGRGQCVWQAFTARRGTVEGGGDGSRACDSYRQWSRDVDLVARLGLTAYRFSVSWARVVPEGRGRWRSDFVGINYYTRRVMAAAPDRPLPWRVVGPRGDVERTDEGWEVAPDSLRDLLVRLHRDYPGVPMMVTENGAVYGDGPTHDGQVHDERRIAFLLRHLRAVAEAIDAGAPVVGYLHWSLMDNFEWALGYRPRFGLVYVDYPSGRLTIKDSGHVYARIAATGQLPSPAEGLPCS